MTLRSDPTRNDGSRPRSRRRPSLALSALAAVSLGLVSVVGGVAASASAAPVGTFADLSTALSSCTSGTTVTLSTDISATASTLTAGCDAILDLNGHKLAVQGIVLSSGVQFEVTDGATGGELDAVAAGANAGIQATGATITIDGGKIVATGAGGGAGIGGGQGLNSGTIVINGGTVTGNGSSYDGGLSAAGIGSGAQSSQENSISITGGDVTGNGGASGAGIGSGIGSALGSIAISGGTVHANGPGGAGIGTGNTGDGTHGTITISGGANVTATGTGGAGIGSGFTESMGPITISNSTVVAEGTNGAAGIGGGTGGSVASITINSGSNVTASAQDGGTAIGGGDSNNFGLQLPAGTGGTITIANGATVTASASGSVIGSIAGVGGWTLSLGGTLFVTSGAFSVPTGITPTIASTGKLLGTLANPSGGGSASGAGGITNDGVIGLATANVSSALIPNITDHNYLVTFVPLTGPNKTVRVFADTFADGYRSLPATSGPSMSWNTEADGSGTWFTTADVLTGDLTLYEAHNDDVVAPLDATANAGDTTTYSATTNGSVDTSGVVITSDEPTDVISGLSVVATKAGVHNITITVNGTPYVTTLTVLAGPIASVDITAPASTVAQGKSLTFVVTGADQYGNPVSATGAVLTSSMPTDVIDGLTVTFPHASPHTITATLGAFSSSVTVQVIPDTTALTGVDVGSTLETGLGILLLGALVLLVRRLRRKPTEV
jgi:hypothetical protein